MAEVGEITKILIRTLRLSFWLSAFEGKNVEKGSPGIVSLALPLKPKLTSFLVTQNREIEERKNQISTDEGDRGIKIKRMAGTERERGIQRERERERERERVETCF